MKVIIVYRGNTNTEYIDCKECFPHTAGGWMLKEVDENKNDIFIGACDVRSIKFINPSST